MAKTKTTKYDVSEHLRTSEEMAAYLETCIEEANRYAAFIAKALGDVVRAKAKQIVPPDRRKRHSPPGELSTRKI